jgi:hypothetical protein
MKTRVGPQFKADSSHSFWFLKKECFHQNKMNQDYRFTAQWLVYILRGLTFRDSTFCPQTLLPWISRTSNQQWVFPHAAVNDGFYNRHGTCLLRGTAWIFKYNSRQFSPYRHPVALRESQGRQGPAGQRRPSPRWPSQLNESRSALISRALFGYPNWGFPWFSSVVRQMPGYTMQSRGTARTPLP